MKKKLVIPLDEHIKAAGALLARLPPLGLVDGVVARPAVRHPDLLHDRVARRAVGPVRKGQGRLSNDFREDGRGRQTFPRARQGPLWHRLERRARHADRLDLHVSDGLLRRVDPANPEGQPRMGVDEAQGDQLRPQIQSDAGLRVLDYLHRLKEFSPPDILEMDWDRRTTSFLSGETALAYCWTVRAARFENDVSSAVKRKVRYLPQPRGPGGASNNPMGGFLLCIPSNVPAERVELAFEAIAWMTSPEAMKANVQNGFPVAPRFSVVRGSRGGGDIADRQRRRQAGQAKPAQGLAPPAGARVPVARSHPRRGNPSGRCERKLPTASARECADPGGPGHAGGRLLLRPQTQAICYRAAAVERPVQRAWDFDRDLSVLDKSVRCRVN